MKRIVLLVFVLIQLFGYAQNSITIDLKGVANKKISSNITAGSFVEIVEINKGFNSLSSSVVLLIDGKTESISYGQLDKISIEPNNSKEFWTYQALKHSTYENLLKSGLQYELRHELENDALQYIDYVYERDLIFNDSFSESYLYSLSYRIYPVSIFDERLGLLNVRILKDINPNAFIFPNGTFFVTTGLLSTINSEEELMAVLAHEIAHFVLDHSVININKAIQRKKNAEFWASFATIAAAVSEISLATKDYYFYGSLTNSTAVIAQEIANSIEERLGLKFSREQEREADECAEELLMFLSVNPLALSSALQKIKNYYILNGNYYAISGYGSHPSLEGRIREIGNPATFIEKNIFSANNKKYDSKVSLVNTFNSKVELNNQHFISCLNLAKRNIDANVATEDDFLLASIATLNMFDNEQSNIEALGFINKAKSLNVYPNIHLSKYEAILLIRLKKLSEAKVCLQKYKAEIESKISGNDKIIDSKQWEINNRYINIEYEWAAKMIYKVDKL